MNDAIKHDSGKPRFELIPAHSLKSIANVMTYGAKKYGDRNWEKGLEYGRLYGAAHRHMNAWWSGEDTDPETGESHLAHAAACMMMLLDTHFMDKTDLDDRPLR